SHIYAAPGKGGIEELATCVDIDEMDIQGLIKFAKETEIDLTIVGPENPLNAGIADAIEKENLKIFAPRKNAEILESSKDFDNLFIDIHAITTAKYQTITYAEQAKAYIESDGAQIVIKEDGLAEGKGVTVALTVTEALEVINEMIVEKTFQEE